MQKMFTQMEGPVKGKAFSIEVMAVLGIRILKPRHSNLIWHLWACIQMKLGKCQLKHQPISFWCFWGKTSVLFHCRRESKMIVKGASRRVIIIWWVWRHCVLSGGNVLLLTFCHKRFVVRDFLDFNCWWWSAWWSFVIGFVWSFGRRNRSISRRWHDH